MDDDRSLFGLKRFWRKRKRESLRSTLWSLAQKECESRGRTEVWIADVVAILLQESGVKAALSAVGEDPDELLAATRRFQTSEEQPDVASRSGTFLIGEDAHTWPLDRAVDRADARCLSSRKEKRPARALDVLVACLAASERELVGPIFPRFEELRLLLEWWLSHGDAPQVPAVPDDGRCALVLHDDDFTPDEAIVKLLEDAFEWPATRAKEGVTTLRASGTLALGEVDVDDARGLLEQVEYTRRQTHHPVRVDLAR